jgi:hypothetical protein
VFGNLVDLRPPIQAASKHIWARRAPKPLEKRWTGGDCV